MTVSRLLSTLVALVLLPAGALAEKPNIVLIFADDQCFETIGAFGMTDIETPNLDRLVEEGTTFTHAYNMGGWNGAICVASRHMLNTGAYLWRAKAISENIGKEKAAHPDVPDFQKEGRMWSQLMKKGGYDTYMTGKWHVKADAEKIFDVARHVRPGMPNQTEEGYNRPVQGVPDVWSPFDTSFGGYWKGGRHWSEVVADDALDYISMAKEKDNPFFMYLAFNAPHDPRQAPREYIEKYPLDRIEVPENFLAEYPYNKEMDCSPSLRDEKLAPFPRTKYAVQVHRQEYYALITHLDTQIGKILDALDASGKREDTYIFFSADHGLSVGHHGLIGKQNPFDHSIRVPFVAVGPGIEASKKIDSPIYLQDVMPTSLDLAGIEIPEDVQFQSLVPALKEGGKAGYDEIYFAYLESQRAIVKDGYKLILYPRAPKALLFDLESDPLEMTDVSGEHPAKVSALFRDLLKLQKTMDDSLDLMSAFPNLADGK